MGVRGIKEPSLTGCTSKDHQQWWYRYDPTWLAIVTGICVKVWQKKPGTGHDEEGNSLKANNLRKLASKSLTNSKRLTRKKHHQPKELNSGIAHSNMRSGYHSFEGSGIGRFFSFIFLSSALYKQLTNKNEFTHAWAREKNNIFHKLLYLFLKFYKKTQNLLKNVLKKVSM